ncbi:MAG: UDP-N-acetylmuramoyl-L-alanine--D-glutamate ligase [Clostridiales Family XIII bacterium]|jgi:UDP-N-acetylmuramoylalanine--D-glutamate ligase|nr:UDP-N-acetylmuramoyl-L-alanine--D-glutamate ligase [Clostridiales Family XIII bacterium]
MLDGKKILIVGLARSGEAAARAAGAQGAEVWGYDRKTEAQLPPGVRALFSGPQGLRLYCGGKEPDAGERWDLLVVSPGVPMSLPLILRAGERGAEIIGELELAWRMGRARYAAVTGTNGKTTTTTLLGEMFRDGGLKSRVAGNIGSPAVTETLAEGMDEQAWMVTEVSSFQLEGIKDFRPSISVLLNITPDHLNRHGNMESYAAAKARIFEKQEEGDWIVVNRDDEAAWKLTKGCPPKRFPFSRTRELPAGAFVRAGFLVIRNESGRDCVLCREEELKIPGAHNLENALAASAAAFCVGISPEHIAGTLRRFAGVAHRLELVDVIGGVRFVNDSKGTNPDASVKALEAVNPGIFLIAGGYDKNAEFDGFVAAFGGKVRRLLLLGVTAEKIRAAAAAQGFLDVTDCGDMERCVETGFKLAREGDTVLLSPACASWDMYGSFEERGEHFRQCVKGLKR